MSEQSYFVTGETSGQTLVELLGLHRSFVLVASKFSLVIIME